MKKEHKSFVEKLAGRMYPFDHLVVIYCWTILIIAVNFARPLNDYLGLLFFHSGVIILVILIASWVRPDRGRFHVFIRLLYPIILMTFFYQSSGQLAKVVIPGFYDVQIVEFEKALMGTNPTLWLDNHLSLFLTELMSAGYFSYYFMIPGLALCLFLSKRDFEMQKFMTATCAIFFLSYLIFIFYPIQGPRFQFAGLYRNEISGLFFRPLVDFIIDRAAFRGGAMPSSHVAEALVVMLFAIRYYGRRAWFLIPVIGLLSLGTVYGRFHYITDVAAGFAIAFIVYWVVTQLYPQRKKPGGAKTTSDIQAKDLYVSHNY